MSSKINTTGTNTLTTLITLVKTALGLKVDKEAGKGLSSNDFTDAEKEKLANLAEGATNVSVVDNLTSTDASAALSANQGKVLSDKIDAAVSSVYKPGGSVAFASLPTADQAHLGMVYNISDAFTTNADFLDGAGKSFPAGTNVVIVAEGAGFKYDALAGFVDLSGYVASADLQELTEREVTDLWNSITV